MDQPEYINRTHVDTERNPLTINKIYIVYSKPKPEMFNQHQWDQFLISIGVGKKVRIISLYRHPDTEFIEGLMEYLNSNKTMVLLKPCDEISFHISGGKRRKSRKN